MNRFESMSDLIYVKDDVMDKDFCSHLISKFEEDGYSDFQFISFL